MTLLNTKRPPVFCPGCSHERIAHALDTAFGQMGLRGNQIVIVSDIGCSGLFDTFFNTHAMHGLHGRALTYAAGLKLARPDLHVIVTMGDGGLGIGGAHLLAACRRNLNLTLLILNNFNFGMTGGQFSATTPQDAKVGSGFLNQLEQPFDVCKVAASAGAAYVSRCSAYRKDLPDIMEKAIRFDGFSLVDIWGICTGRYTRHNRLTPKIIEERLAVLPVFDGPVAENQRKEYTSHYREIAAGMKTEVSLQQIEKKFQPLNSATQSVIILGSAGQRILTAGEILCLAGMSAGLYVTQKNDYPITVLRGHSISEVILSGEPVTYTGIENPTAVIALAQEGIDRSRKLFDRLDANCLILQAADTHIPDCKAKVMRMDFKAQKIKDQDRALAALSVLACSGKIISAEMLEAALTCRFPSPLRESILELVHHFISYRFC
ncbi:MAG: thiamine pyrophosphate-dependent enzyme [Desulfobacterales bacterium]